METIAQRAGSVLRLGSVALALLVASIAAHAQGDDEGDKTRAAKLLDEGNALFASKRYETALKRYEAAYAAFPSPKILLNLAEVTRELGLADQAADYYERFLAEAGDGVDPKHRSFAEHRVAELEVGLGRIAIEGPAGLDVRLDGKPRGALPIPPKRVTPGRHTVEADGFTEDVTVRAGHVATVRIPDERTPEVPLVAVPAPAEVTPAIAPPPPPIERAEDDTGTVLGTWWFWTSVGALAAGAVVVGIAASSGGDDFVPGGELGRVSTADWTSFTPGGGR